MSSRLRPSDSVMVHFGQKISRHTLIYGAAMALVFPASIVNVAVITRYLPPVPYGRLGLLLTYAAFLTLLYNVGLPQGVMMWVYGTTGDEDAEVDAGAQASTASERRRALGSGLVVTAAIAAAGTVPVVLAARPLATLLLGTPALRTAVVWAALSAAAGAVWRIVLQVFRMERRAGMFAVGSGLRPLLVVGLSLALLERGDGIEGVLAATAIGTGASVLWALFAARRSYRFAPRLSDVGEIYRRGGRFAPMVIGLWVAHSADLILLSRYAPGETVGLYRLASRIGAFPSYVTSAYLMSWVPLQQSSLGDAAIERKGRTAFASTLFTYLCLLSTGLLVFLGLGADVLVRLGASSYRDAAHLIPLVATGPVVNALLYGLFRSASFRHKHYWFAGLCALSGAFFIGLALLLVPPFGAYGAALSVTGSLLLSAVGMVLLIRRAPEPVPFQWGRIGAGALIGGACYALGALTGLSGAAGAVVVAGALVLFPVLLVLLRVVPPAEARQVLAIAAAPLLPPRERDALIARVSELPEEQRAVAVHTLCRRETAEQAAAALGIPASLARARLTRALRTLIDRPGATAHDDRIGDFLLHDGPTVERDGMASELHSVVDPWELHLLDEAREQLRAAPRAAWRDMDRPAPAAGAIEGPELTAPALEPALELTRVEG